MNLNNKFTLIVIFSLLLTSCAPYTATLKLTPEEETYLEKVKTFPVEFSISKEEVNDVWGRAQSWIGRYSSMKIQIATDYVIQTYNPAPSDVKFGYYVTKTPVGNEIQITVQCNCGNMFSTTDANINAHILAYYIKTGVVYPRLIAK